MRIKSEHAHIIIKDDSRHEYLILENQLDNFRQWDEAMGNGENSRFDFDDYRINGARFVKIYEWEMGK